MNKMNKCMVNHEDETIYVRKSFMKNASKYGTDEYNEFAAVKRDFPAYKVEIIKPKKAEGKMSMKGLTWERMVIYILTQFGADSEEYREFLNQKHASTGYSNAYMYMRKWFIKTYPNWDDKQEKRDEARAERNADKIRIEKLKQRIDQESDARSASGAAA